MKAPHFPSLFAVLRHHAAERPHAPALRARGEDGLDYATLKARVEVMARNLALRHGVTIGHRVAYLGLSRVDQIVLLFALARLGALLAPLNHRLAQAEWRTILADCAPSLLVHDGDWRPAANDLAQGAHLACAALDSLVAPPDSPAPWPQQPSDAAVAKVRGHRKRATTTDLYGHLRGDDSAAVAAAVAASFARFARAGGRPSSVLPANIEKGVQVHVFVIDCGIDRERSRP